MNKSAEEFIRHNAFPLDNKSDEEWEEWKNTHKGTNWVGFAIKAMEEYAAQQAIEFAEFTTNYNPTAGIKYGEINWEEDSENGGSYTTKQLFNAKLKKNK